MHNPLLFSSREADIFVFAGQSNTQSNVTTLEGVPAYIVSDPKVLIWDYDTSAFITYGAGTNSLQPTTQIDGGSGSSGNWGPEAEFSYRMRLLAPAKKIFIVKYAIGGSRLFATTGNDWSESSSSEYFTNVERAINAAKLAIFRQGLIPRVRMILWMQGETDAGDATWDAAYPTNLPNVLTAMRARWAGSATKIIVGRINSAWATFPNVRLAQVTAGNAGPLNQWLDTDAYALTSNHFNDVGCSQFGRDVFYAYLGFSEKVVNGTFTVDASSWSGVTYNGGAFVSDSSCLSQSAGALLVTNVSGHSIGGGVQQIAGLTIGATYRVKATVTRNDTNAAKLAVTVDNLGLGSDFGGADYLYNSADVAGTGVINGSFVAAAGSYFVSVKNHSFSDGVVSFDDISVFGP